MSLLAQTYQNPCLMTLWAEVYILFSSSLWTRTDCSQIVSHQITSRFRLTICTDFNYTVWSVARVTNLVVVCRFQTLNSIDHPVFIIVTMARPHHLRPPSPFRRHCHILYKIPWLSSSHCLIAVFAVSIFTTPRLPPRIHKQPLHSLSPPPLYFLHLYRISWPFSRYCLVAFLSLSFNASVLITSRPPSSVPTPVTIHVSLSHRRFLLPQSSLSTTFQLSPHLATPVNILVALSRHRLLPPLYPFCPNHHQCRSLQTHHIPHLCSRSSSISIESFQTSIAVISATSDTASTRTSLECLPR